jgi:hypothetical protein
VMWQDLFKNRDTLHGILTKSEMAFMSSCITTRRAFVGYDGIDVGILTRLPWHTHQELPNTVVLSIQKFGAKITQSLDRKPLQPISSIE